MLLEGVKIKPLRKKFNELDKLIEFKEIEKKN